MNAAGERVAVVTGASAGIGLYTALGLARQGMRVVMVGRDPARTCSGCGFWDTGLNPMQQWQQFEVASA